MRATSKVKPTRRAKANDQILQLTIDVQQIANEFDAVRRLAWEIEDGDRDLSHAAGRGVESLCAVSRDKANEIAKRLAAIAESGSNDAQ